MSPIRNLREKTILDAGCGAGALTKILAKIQPQSLIVGIDFSRKSVKFAKDRLNAFANVEFIVGDLRFLPFIKCFQIVVFSEVLEHIMQERRMMVLSELLRVTLSRGYLFLTTPNGLYPTIFVRKFLHWMSRGHLRGSITTQIYDHPASPSTLTRLLSSVGWKVISYNYAEFWFAYRVIKRIALPRIFVLAQNQLIVATHYSVYQKLFFTLK